MKLTNELIELEILESALKLFGQKLRAARVAQNLTQVQVGTLIGRAGNTVAMIERGEQPPGFDAMEAIFANLGQPPAYYFSEDRPPLPKQKPTPEEALDVLREAIRSPVVAASPLLMRIGKLEEDQRRALFGLINEFLRKNGIEAVDDDNNRSNEPS